ncbi:hypothetical protein QQF64_010547 [Cirrhinus molitorella]|uniref:Uncharacterized protein n=1 Tax=Cirrhinus molitorella TaxID=172907 RepID=A0ABR3M4E6_9TELE
MSGSPIGRRNHISSRMSAPDSGVRHARRRTQMEDQLRRLAQDGHQNRRISKCLLSDVPGRPSMAWWVSMGVDDSVSLKPLKNKGSSCIWTSVNAPGTQR